MSLLFNMLPMLVIAFLPRGECLLISWLQSPSAVILEPKKIKSLTVSIVSTSIYHEVMGQDSMILVFWMLRFKPAFSLSCFTFIFSSLLSAIRVISSAYLRLLIFPLAILIPAYASSTLAFCKMYSEYRLNKQSDNIQPWHTPFPIWNQSDSCCFLTCIQISQEAGQVVWYSHLLKNFPQFVVIHTVNRESNGTPLQYSCLENPRDGGAWWAAVYGVAQSRTRLKLLSSSSGRWNYGMPWS